jgi:membrane-bound lytic murein transglycosylase
MRLCLYVFLGSVAAAGLGLADRARAEPGDEPFKLADSQLEPVKWTDVEGWAADDHLAAFTAYQTSCQVFLKIKRPPDDRPIAGGLWDACRRAAALRPSSGEEARAFFEANFRPVRIARLGEAQGFLTGYYEPIVQGSRFPNPEFNVPLYRRPNDLVAAGQKPGADAFPNKGAQIGRLNEKSEIVPYHDRGAIEGGALDGQKLEICWLKDPFEALSIQIQGSARVILEDGTPLRINYDSHNGYPYTAVGRVLIERNLVPREEMSMQRIRDWMAANPDEAPKLRATNRSYVFFRITGLSNDGEPVGAQGVPLSPVDRSRQDPRLRHALLHRCELAGRERQAHHAVPPADDRAGHRLGHCRAGPRGPVLGCGRRCRPHRRPYPSSRPLCHAAAARARHGRGRPPYAAAGREAEDPRRGDQERTGP